MHTTTDSTNTYQYIYKDRYRICIEWHDTPFHYISTLTMSISTTVDSSVIISTLNILSLTTLHNVIKQKAMTMIHHIQFNCVTCNYYIMLGYMNQATLQNATLRYIAVHAVECMQTENTCSAFIDCMHYMLAAHTRHSIHTIHTIPTTPYHPTSCRTVPCQYVPHHATHTHIHTITWMDNYIDSIRLLHFFAS